MGKQLVYLDDHDEKVLRGDVRPIRVSVGDVWWSVYLSKENEDALRTMVSNFVPQTPPHQGPPTPKGRPRAGASTSLTSPGARLLDQLKGMGKTSRDVKAWAAEQGLAFSEKGRLPTTLLTRYLDAHAEASPDTATAG